ncbi:uncharacterized protein [Drosophila virilis]|uniref:Enkurin domain-containing protein n=1 Tax=Drosophila virilis TaxID=7244 RepID=B4M780_DROVI|nr:uncharacterized protein LOC6633327 [Drosophila virilis]EDW62647.1 uncharacterized protein Dvir_GJ16940 [Drosophila virilis]
MWMKRSAAMGQVTQRNFLRENKLLVRQTPMMTLRRLDRDRHRDQEREREREREQWHWPPASYELPTAASLAHRSGTLPLVETQRRLIHGGRQGRAFYGVGQRSEKQIQTEDISDEQFLNAALLKCTEQAHGQGASRSMRGCSEGDELPVPSPVACDQTNASCLRRTASNFELGTVPAQRGNQSMKHLQHRPLSGVVDTVPAQLEQLHQLDHLEHVEDQPADGGDSLSNDARPSAPPVLQLAIPDITDVEPEPQLDQSLSARTNVSCHSQTEPTPASEALQPIKPDQNVRKLGSGQEQVLLTEAQRIALLEAAQARHRELIWEYNRLPISMGTLRVRNLKIQLEQQLDLIDSDLTMLNLPQVYIRRDQLQQISSISC